jgi:glycerate kinase
VRVVLAPDCFGGTASAAEAARALADGWRAVRPQDELVELPLSDGGPGFVDVLPGRAVTALVEDPLARPVLATFRLDGGTAYVESAQAAGLHLLAPDERDPTVTTTYGVGQLVVAAIEAGARRVVVGLGGSATNDGGAGLLAALGVVRVDLEGGRLEPGGLALARADRLIGEPRPVELVAATDVVDPLLGETGASRAYGPQKGATPAQVEQLEAALARWADVVEEHLRVRARDLPGAGAAGGLGFALLALGAERVAGATVVAEAVGLGAAVAGADLVVTGEGRLDGSSLRGKVVSAVAAEAARHGVPCVVVAGEVALGRREAGAAGLTETVSLVELVGRPEALAHATAALRTAGEGLARAWGV